jgi:hypothetical protein
MSRLCKKHPIAGWLSLAGPDYRRSFDKLLLERDRLNDPTHSEPAPDYVAWCWREELPALASAPFYRNQLEQRLEHLDKRTESLERRIRDLAGSVQLELKMVTDEKVKLAKVLGIPIEDG